MVSTTSNGIKRGASNKKWITKEEFKKVYPKGYRECYFFSSPVEFWSMSKEACLNWKKTALLDLSSKLKFQKNLQQTSIIGNSSDTKLLTELLNLNNKDYKIEFTDKNTTTDINVNTVTDGLLRNISKTKKCYTCINVCKCSKLLSNRLKNNLRITNDKKVAVLSKAQLVFPDIQLIDQFDKSSIKSSLQKHKFKLSDFILNNNEVSVAYITYPNISENSSMVQIDSNSELETNYGNYLTLPQETADNIESRLIIPVDNEVANIERASTQIIHESRPITPIENEVIDIETALTKIIHESRATSPVDNEVVDIERASTQIIHESRPITPIENEVINIEMASTQIIHESRATTPIENEIVDVERVLAQITQDESTIDENNEYINNVLKYFHLNSISDIFQDLHDDDIMDNRV